MSSSILEPAIAKQDPRTPLRARLRIGAIPLISGSALLLAALVLAVLGITVWNSAAETYTGNTNLEPSLEHLLGTDSFGRDILARAFAATALSVQMAAIATAGILLGAIIIGAGLWALPIRIREAGLRLLEVSASYPEILIAVFLAAILGTGTWQLTAAVILANIPIMARLVSNLTAALILRDFVVTSRLLGARPGAIIRFHLLPNMAEPLLIQAASTFAMALVSMSALSFVGLGVQRPTYDLGSLLASALGEIYTRPYTVLAPALMLTVVSFGAMLIGDGLAALSDPRSIAANTRPRRSRPSVPAPESGTDAVPASAHVRVRDLRVALPSGEELVKGVTFDIARGEVLGLVGESGSGKSLTALALADLLPQNLVRNCAELRVGELDLTARPDQGALARTIGLIYQDPTTSFNPAWRLRHQLTEVLRTHRGTGRKAAEAHLARLLNTLRISAPERLMSSFPYELSGGMKQRAMLAAALSASPSLLIADEPTTALDVTVQAGILRELRSLADSSRTTMLFISHDLGVVQELCDRVIVMKEGVIVESLTAADLRAGKVEHPYTRQLLDAVPTIAYERQGVLDEIG